MPDPKPSVQAPELPKSLLNPMPMIAVGAVLWLAVAIAAFTVPSLQTWRPIAVAGLGVGAFGLFLFTWQRGAARRGSKGAQDVLRDM